MTFAIVVLCLFLIGVFINRKKNPPLSKVVMAALAGLILLLQAIQWIGGYGGGGRRGPEPTPFEEAAAWKIGRAVADRVRRGGEVVLLQDASDSRANRARVSGLERALEGTEWSVAPTEMTVREEEDMGMAGDLWLSIPFVRRVLDENPKAVAVISAMGIPSNARQVLSRDDPPWFLLDVPDLSVVGRELKEGLFAACVLPAPGADWSVESDPSMTLEERFEMRYRLVTPEDL
jgi:hypothetical protein